MLDDCFLSSKLSEINEIRFTPREIDIIACLLNGKSAKSTSLLLGISPYTFNTHVRNIMTKTNCFSHDKIIKFFESSSQHLLIHSRYIDLIIFFKFETTLKQIASSNHTTKYSCEFHMYDKKSYPGKDILSKYLELAGISVKTTRQKPPNFSFPKNDFHIICSSEIDVQTYDTNILFLKNTNDSITLEGYLIENSMEDDNEYLHILECIRLICKSDPVDQLLGEFKKYYSAKRQSNLGVRSTAIVKTINLVQKRKTKRMTTSIFMVLAIIGFLTIYHYCNSPKKTLVMNIPPISDDILLSREKTIASINEAFEKQKGIKIAVLIGPGGAGKTTIARNYLNKHSFNFKWEINAETYNSALDSFSNLAIALADTSELREKLEYIQAISNYKVRNEQIISFVFSQLKTFNSWCFLFDNVDDFNIIRQFIPFNSDLYGNGRVIFTTRNENVKNASFLNQLSAINIKNLDKKESAELFCHILYGKNATISSDKSTEIEKFLADIPAMPLDVSAAAYYIKNTHTPFSEYSKIAYGNQATEKVESKFIEESFGYRKNRYGIVTSIFDNILQVNQKFKELLLFICLLDSQNIPKQYLEKFKNPVIVQEFMHHLRRFSLIITQGDSFSIHRSTQKIGLKYVFSLLSPEEKIKYISEIVKIMTPYEHIASRWYDYYEHEQEMTLQEMKTITIHVESILKNIATLQGLEKFDEYRTKLLLSLFYTYYVDKQINVAQSIAEEILKINQNKNYIYGYDLVVLLLTITRLHLFQKDFLNKNMDTYLSQAIKICSQIEGANNLKVRAFCEFFKIYFERGHVDLSLSYLEKAKEIILNSKNQKWFLALKVWLYAYYYQHYYVNHCVIKKEMEKIVRFYLETLNECEKIDYSDKRKTYFSCCLLKDLAMIYNRLEQYDEASKYEDIFSCKSKTLNGINELLLKCALETEQGYTLLRTNELQKAYDILTSITSKKDLIFRDSNKMLQAFVYRSEASIRLGKLQESYDDCKNAIGLTSKSSANFPKLMNITCLYNMAIVKYKQKEFSVSAEHFNAFFEKARTFCNGFVDSDTFNQLEKQRAFDSVHDASKLKQCLENSLKIFSAIYGETHSFVKNYVSKN